MALWGIYFYFFICLQTIQYNIFIDSDSICMHLYIRLCEFPTIKWLPMWIQQKSQMNQSLFWVKVIKVDDIRVSHNTPKNLFDKICNLNLIRSILRDFKRYNKMFKQFKSHYFTNWQFAIVWFYYFSFFFLLLCCFYCWRRRGHFISFVLQPRE